MSTYLVIDIDEIVDAILETWSSSDRYRALREREEAELKRQKERLRAEQERLSRLAREQEEAERKARKEYEDALRAVEKKYAAQIVRHEAQQAVQLEERRKETALLASQLLREGEHLASPYLADIANFRDHRAAYEEIADLQRRLKKEAQVFIEDHSPLSGQDAGSALAVLEEAVRSLKSLFEKLCARLRSVEGEQEETQEKADRYAQLLTQLAEGTQEAVRQISVLPAEITAQAREALEVQAALDIVRHYLLSPESVYLNQEEKDELRRLYDLRETGGELERISARSGRQLRAVNAQFRAAKKRSFDRVSFFRRRRLHDLEDRYLNMYETVYGSLAGAEEPVGDAVSRIRVYEAEIQKLQRRYTGLLRKRLLDRTLEQALRKSRPGMQVRRIAETGTEAGNHRTLYQIGEDGTALEVYQDARGQILMEAGGIVADEASVTAAQEEAISRNNRFFCSHQLPAILETFSEELQAAELGSRVMLKREPQEDDIHVFSLSDYPPTQENALVIEKDGTLRRQAAAGHQERRQRHFDEE